VLSGRARWAGHRARDAPRAGGNPGRHPTRPTGSPTRRRAPAPPVPYAAPPLSPGPVLLSLAAAVPCLLVAAAAVAQIAPGAGAQPDTPIGPAERAAVVESLATAVSRYYVFPDRGAALAKALRRRLAAHEYDRITSSMEFADSLRAHLQAFTHDLHMRVHYRAEPIPVALPDSVPPSERERMHQGERVRNFGFERVQRLAGNVGYLDLRSFSGDPAAQATAVAAMNFLGETDGLIVDLRRNGGGSPAMIQTLLTYLVADDQHLHFNDFYRREGDRTDQWWTAAQVPGRRFAGRPVVVLTSALTGSAAEEFAYDVQTHGLGTLFGATTAGAANPGGMFRLSDHLAAFIATGRAINPVTHTNWEGVGVKPDHDVPPGEALREAHVFVLGRLLEAATDPADRDRLTRATEQAKATAPDPAEDFERGPRRAR
jgi:hypothetical protein